MKEMIKNYRGTLISSGLVILAGILVGFTSIQGKWLNVFFIVMQCALVTIIFYDNRNRQQSRKVIGMTIWIIPVITLIYNGIARLVNMGADTENLFMNISKVLSLKQRKTFQTLKFQNLILIRNFLIKLMPCWIKPRLHISPDFWFPNHGCMSTEEAVPGLWLRK